MPSSPDPLQRHHPPLSASAFYLLLALAREAGHGYSIKGRIYSDSQGMIAIADGTLYPLLRRYCNAGLIKEAGVRSTASGREQMHYELTPAGSNQLKTNLKRMRHAVEVGKTRGLFADELPPDIQQLLEGLK